jgi:ribosomal protein S27E
MQLICPECKNEIDISGYPDLTGGSVVECNHCGITLQAKEDGDNFTAEVIDEGK